MKPSTLHPDGRVTYWSVYAQQWVDTYQRVPDRELAAMSALERRMIVTFQAGDFNRGVTT